MPLSLRDTGLAEALYGDNFEPLTDEEAAYTEEELLLEDDDDELPTGEELEDVIRMIGFDPREWETDSNEREFRKKRKVHMPIHDVRFTPPALALGVVDADFVVRKDGKPFGTLKISQGAVVWIPGRGKNHRSVTWTALATFIASEGTVIKKAKKKAAAKKSVKKAAK